MNIQLPILGGHVLMGTDAPESTGFKMIKGNNVNINLQPDTLEEAQRLFDELSKGGKVETPLQKMFWGDYFASFSDKFGIYWIIICSG
jgi:PhnB protein